MVVNNAIIGSLKSEDARSYYFFSFYKVQRFFVCVLREGG